MLQEFGDLQALLKEANNRHLDLLGVASALVENRELDADKVIQELINAAGVKQISSGQFEAAHKRFLIGNPPGKKKTTIGDELNWEFLLHNVPMGEDLHLVSADGDYASPYDPAKVNSFLLREWKEVKGAELHYYGDLNDFFKLHVPKIKLANQAKLNALISELAGSLSFATTHSIVAKFPEDPEFNDAQIEELINIKNNNSQVGWIVGDPDVSAFYGPIEERFGEIQKPMAEPG